MHEHVEQALAKLPDPLKKTVEQRWRAFTETFPDLGQLPQAVAESLPQVWAASNNYRLVLLLDELEDLEKSQEKKLALKTF